MPLMEDDDEDKELYPHLLDDDEEEEEDAIERNYSLPQPKFHSKIGIPLTCSTVLQLMIICS